MHNHFSFAVLGSLLPVLALSSLPSNALANCADNAYLGQVCMVGATFCPSNTQGADGRLLNISEYEPLYALLGNTYGGDGVNTFGLPNLNGRMPVGLGQGAGLGQSVAQGQLWGAENNALTTATMPAHIHTAISTLSANTTIGSAAAPSSANNALAGMAVQELTGSGVVTAQRWAAPEGDSARTTAVAGLGTTLAATGGNQPFETRPPSLGIRYCVVTQGIFPPFP